MELGHRPALELGYISAFELGSSPTLVLGCKRYLEYSPALELRRKRTLPPRNNFKPEVWHKNNPMCKLVECISSILKIKDEKIC